MENVIHHLHFRQVRNVGFTFLSVLILPAVLFHTSVFGQDEYDVYERMPSRSHFFDWINSQYEGSTETQTLINMEFFQWLHDVYGMILDVYALDVGNIDDGPYTAGVGRLIPYHYGTMKSEEFKTQFPNGFTPLVHKAAGFGGRLAVWMGPDGFGNTPEEEKARTDMLISLCRDYNFIAFKIDAVAGQLRPEKQELFKKTIQTCRTYCPDLMILNHRVNFGTARSVVTTSLWEGVETYIDVFMPNDRTAAHHRAGALARELPPGLTRRLEDHGVCLSSCLDFWEDELVLQTFNRSLLLSPSIYGNPWFLRDDEFPKLARIFNLHERYKDILIEAVVLPEDRYGPYAVSRGDDGTRLITLRNLTWHTKTYRLRLDESIGLRENDTVAVRRFFPTERILGNFSWSGEVDVQVLPFRTCLILASTERIEEIGVLGCDYEIIREIPGKPTVIRLLGMPGTTAHIRLPDEYRQFAMARVDGIQEENLIKGREIRIRFPGKMKKEHWHKKTGVLEPCNVPADAEALFEATCFAADNNALEVRAVQRSGPSQILQVIAARDAFFNKKMFVNRGIWDKNLFDSNLNTFFMARLDKRALRVDFGEAVFMDQLVIRVRDRQEHDLNPALHAFDEDTEMQVSADLKTWTTLDLGFKGKGTIAQAHVPSDAAIRYLRIHGAPQRMAEIEAYLDETQLDRSQWRASNLFQTYKNRPAVSAWYHCFHLQEVTKNSYLAVALNGRHGNEGGYAALRVGGRYIGAPDRSVSFPSNTWEYYNVESDSNYTYYFPLTPELLGEDIEVFVLILDDGFNRIKPEAWMTAYPIPYESRELILF